MKKKKKQTIAEAIAEARYIFRVIQMKTRAKVRREVN